MINISQNSDQLSKQKQNLQLERKVLVKVLHKQSKKKSALSLSLKRKHTKPVKNLKEVQLKFLKE